MKYKKKQLCNSKAAASQVAKLSNDLDGNFGFYLQIFFLTNNKRNQATKKNHLNCWRIVQLLIQGFGIYICH